MSEAENDYLDHLDAIEGWLHAVHTDGLGTALGKYDPTRSVDLLDSATNLDAPFWEVRRVFNAHPPLFKYLALLSRNLLRGWPFPLAERLPTALVFGGACAALFAALARRRTVMAGLVGAVALSTLPRFVSFAGFCTPDMHIAAAWLWAALAFERWEETRKLRWWIVAAAAFAFGLCSKMSILPVLGLLGALSVWWRHRSGPREVLKSGVPVAAMLLAGVVLLVATYPFLWPAPLPRLWLLFTETRRWGELAPFTALFFGDVVPYTKLPWYFAPTLIAMVVPPITLALSLLGLLWPKERDRLWHVGAAGVVFWLLLELVPNTPKYDNERGMMAVFPFIALLAGCGAADLAARLSARITAAMTRALLSAVTLALLLELAFAHPFPLSYFSPLVGGSAGAVRLGFEPTYLMDVLNRDVLTKFQQRIPTGAGLTVRPFENQYMPFLQRRGLLRPDLKLNPNDGPFFILVYRHNVLRDDRSVMVQRAQLVDAVERDGVPLAELWYLPPQ